MKIKKVVLGILVFVFAAGTAFASLQQVSPHIKASAVNSCIIQCTPITVTCSEIGLGNCTVRVNTQAAPGMKVTTVYNDNTCSVPLKNVSTPIITNLNFCDVVQL